MNTKFAIGCLVQWYEVEILPEYIDSLVAAIDLYEKDQVLVDIKLVTNQDLEQLEDTHKLDFILYKFQKQVERLQGYKLNVDVDSSLITVADYRRTFNTTYCELADVLVWGETDMLLPKQAFLALDGLHQNVKTPKYLATFGICKMWDSSWQVLEHPAFTNKQHSDSKEDWWGVNYTMNIDEMNNFNDSVEDLSISVVSPHKFNGCGLVISSEVVKAGVNIPQSVFFVHEDTAFMLMAQKLLGNIPQYHIANLLVVHNRKHPNKRMYIKDETGNTIGEKRKSQKWYTPANKMCEQNCHNLFNPHYKSFTWQDVFKLDS
jgi:hypothetical protein